MNSADLLRDAFDRILDNGRAAAEGLGREQLAHRPGGTGNSIAWLIWHAARVQDDHVADLAGAEQAWTADGWAERFDLDLPLAATGYGHTADEVDAVQADAPTLSGYLAAVHDRTVTFLRTLSAQDYDRVIDENWDPPVTLGVRLISVVDDDIQHVGQAAYVRGLLPQV